MSLVVGAFLNSLDYERRMISMDMIRPVLQPPEASFLSVLRGVIVSFFCAAMCGPQFMCCCNYSYFGRISPCWFSIAMRRETRHAYDFAIMFILRYSVIVRYPVLASPFWNLRSIASLSALISLLYYLIYVIVSVAVSPRRDACRAYYFTIMVIARRGFVYILFGFPVSRPRATHAAFATLC